jgi:hypothetical protein
MALKGLKGVRYSNVYGTHDSAAFRCLQSIFEAVREKPSRFLTCQGCPLLTLV